MPANETRVEWVEANWLELHRDLSLGDLANLTGVPDEMLQALVDWGVLVPADPSAAEPRFSATTLTTVRTAARLRADFSLDNTGIALALTYLARIEALEARVRALSARLPQQ